MTEAVKRAGRTLSEEERRTISEMLQGLDDEVDDLARVLVGALEVLGRAFPDKRESYLHTSEVLMPDGLAVINTSYRNEAGETERIDKRVTDDSKAQEVLETAELNGVKLEHWYDRLVDLGRRLGPLAAKLEVSEDRAEEVILEFKARQKWISLVTTLRRICELAEWSEKDTKAIFGQVDRLSALRAPPREPAVSMIA